MPAVQDSIDAIRIAAAAADRMKATDLVAFDVTEPLAITEAKQFSQTFHNRESNGEQQHASKRRT